MSLYGVIGYHVTLSEGHMIANHPILKETLVPDLVTALIYLSQMYSYYIRGDMSLLSGENTLRLCWFNPLSAVLTLISSHNDCNLAC